MIKINKIIRDDDENRGSMMMRKMIQKRKNAGDVDDDGKFDYDNDGSLDDDSWNRDSMIMKKIKTM